MPGRLGTFQNFPSEVLCVLTTLGDLREHAFPITLADLRAGERKRVNTEITE